MITEKRIIQILKIFEQQDYKKGGVSIDPRDYKAIARAIEINCYKTIFRGWTLIEKTLPPLGKEVLFRDKFKDWQKGTYDGELVLVENEGTMELSEFTEWFEPPF